MEPRKISQHDVQSLFDFGTEIARALFEIRFNDEMLQSCEEHIVNQNSDKDAPCKCGNRDCSIKRHGISCDELLQKLKERPFGIDDLEIHSIYFILHCQKGESSLSQFEEQLLQNLCSMEVKLSNSENFLVEETDAVVEAINSIESKSCCQRLQRSFLKHFNSTQITGEIHEDIEQHTQIKDNRSSRIREVLEPILRSDLYEHQRHSTSLDNIGLSVNDFCECQTSVDKSIAFCIDHQCNLCDLCTGLHVDCKRYQPYSSSMINSKLKQLGYTMKTSKLGKKGYTMKFSKVGPENFKKSHHQRLKHSELQRRNEKPKLKQIQRFELRPGNYYSCCTLPGGEIIFINNRKRSLMKKFKADGTLQSITPVKQRVYDITVMRDTYVALTHPKSKAISIVDADVGKVLQTYTIEYNPGGITFTSGDILFCADKTGLVRLSTNAETCTLSTVHLDTDVSTCSKLVSMNDRICYSSGVSDKIKVLNLQFDVIFEIEICLFNPYDKYFPIRSRDITIDNNGNIYAAGYSTRNLVLISPDGKTVQQLLVNDNGFRRPSMVHFDPHQNQLIVMVDKWTRRICKFSITMS